MGTQTGFPTGDNLPAFSALNLLRNYNQFFQPTGSDLVQVYHHYSCGTSLGDLPHEDHSSPGGYPFPPVIGAFQAYSHFPISTSPGLPDLKSKQLFLTTPSVYARRPRGEKKPIPDDQKDDRYYERRKRNNQAAKKSRDARKLREDQIAFRATLLEHENAILRAQVLTLREEIQSLRQMIMNQKKVYGKSVPVIPKKEYKEEGSLDPDKKWDTEFDLSVKYVNKRID